MSTHTSPLPSKPTASLTPTASNNDYWSPPIGDECSPPQPPPRRKSSSSNGSNNSAIKDAKLDDRLRLTNEEKSEKVIYRIIGFNYDLFFNQLSFEVNESHICCVSVNTFKCIQFKNAATKSRT